MVGKAGAKLPVQGSRQAVYPMVVLNQVSLSKMLKMVGRQAAMLRPIVSGYMQPMMVARHGRRSHLHHSSICLIGEALRIPFFPTIQLLLYSLAIRACCQYRLMGN